MNVGDHGIAVRSKAIGLLEAGVQQRDVALRLSVGLRSIKRWWAASKRGQSLDKGKVWPSENSQSGR